MQARHLLRLAIAIGALVLATGVAQAETYLNALEFASNAAKPKAPDALSDLPTAPKPPQPAARVPPHTPEFANPRNASPSADGTKWDFQKDSTFVLSDGTKRPKGSALRAR